MSRREQPGLDQAFLQAVARIMQSLDQHVNQYIARRLAEHNIQMDAALQLSHREREVFALILQGLTNKEIGGRLSISESTAKFHVRAILRKCGAKSRVDIVREHKIAPGLELVANQRVVRSESPRISLGSAKLGSDQTRRPMDAGRPSRTGSARGTAGDVIQ
jgi:DNA-binding CsgD family transcriptional regulator